MPWKPSRLTCAQLEERRLEGARLLVKNKFSQAEVARELEVSRTTVARWAEALERGGEIALKARVAPAVSPRSVAMPSGAYSRTSPRVGSPGATRTTSGHCRG